MHVLFPIVTSCTSLAHITYHDKPRPSVCRCDMGGYCYEASAAIGRGARLRASPARRPTSLCRQLGPRNSCSRRGGLKRALEFSVDKQVELFIVKAISNSAVAMRARAPLWEGLPVDGPWSTSPKKPCGNRDDYVPINANIMASYSDLPGEVECAIATQRGYKIRLSR